MNWHAKSIEDVFLELKAEKRGLDETEAQRRLIKYGYNELREEKPPTIFAIFLNQFKSFIIGILIIAVIISIAIAHYVDATVIGIILVLNAVLGTAQEYKAERAIEALKKLASLQATVLRNGIEKKIDATLLVPGDIILLETGEKVPADARLIEAVNLETQEAMLTGESLPNKKHTAVIEEKIPVADRTNMVFSGTIITRGRGKAIVTETGMQTEIGKIATMIQEKKTKLTPLQRKLKILGEVLGIAAIVICAIVFFVGIAAGISKLDMFMTALSLAVAAIPEGLPAVVTIALALGVQRMIKRNALIRKLPSVETLGSVTVICADKTGTLTHNQMTVTKLFANNKIINVTGSGYSTTGEFYQKEQKIDPKEFALLLKAGALCNDAKITEAGVIGDPTEAALIVSAAKAGIVKEELELKHPRLEEFEFTSERKRMSTLHNIAGKKIMFTKGAVDVVLSLCNRIYEGDGIRRITSDDKSTILKVNEAFAKQALRVLAFAYKETEKIEEKDLIFIGLQAMIDPPRMEAREAVEKCKSAGIKVVMITGDHKLTAEAVAKSLGIQGRAVDGKELEAIAHLEEHVEEIGVYARIDPKHKVKIVNALKARGHIVAMTGDGVNDAPALKRADIGIAMGITGTDVAKEASDMILTDDNFASIVNAVEEGRSIFDNIRKFVQYLLSSNLGEILTLFIAILARFPLPIVALQILWINLVTDGLPALALGVEPAEPGIMAKPPRNPKEPVIRRQDAARMILVGLIMALGTLWVFRTYNPDVNLEYAQTMAFSVLMMFQMFNVLNCRSDKYSLFKIGILSNIKLIGAITASIALQFAVVYIPFLNSIMHTTPIKAVDWVYVFGVSAVLLVIIEVIKLFQKKGA